MKFFATLSIFIAVMVVYTFGEMLAFSSQQAYAASFAPDHMRGRYSGFLGLAWCVGSSSGAAVGLEVYEHSPNALWLLCAIFGIVAALCLVSNKKEVELAPNLL